MATTAAPSLVLSRPSLEARLDESFGKRLTLLVAGAGYGKSTLVTQWTRDLRSAWYTATIEDRQLSSLASGIADAIRPHVALSGELFAALAGSGEELARAEMLAAQLCDALDSSLPHDLGCHCASRRRDRRLGSSRSRRKPRRAPGVCT